MQKIIVQANHPCLLRYMAATNLKMMLEMWDFGENKI